MTLHSRTFNSETASVTDTITPSNHVPSNNITLRECVENTMRNYFMHLEGADVTDVYNLVLNEVEAPLLATVMDYVAGNQTKASEVLGLNRGTLRKKLKQHNLL